MSEINADSKVRGISQEKLLLKAEPQTPEEEDDHEIINVTDGNTGVILSKPQVVRPYGYVVQAYSTHSHFLQVLVGEFPKIKKRTKVNNHYKFQFTYLKHQSD
jgi:hypothetical protein